jgi:hypothetical protein
MYFMSSPYYLPENQLVFCATAMAANGNILCLKDHLAQYSGNSMADYPFTSYFFKDWKLSDFEREFVVGVLYELLISKHTTRPALTNMWNGVYFLSAYAPSFTHMQENEYQDERCALWSCPSELSTLPSLAIERTTNLNHKPLLLQTHFYNESYASYSPQAEGFAKVILASALLVEWDLHGGNIGIVRNDGQAWFARVDYDHSFASKFKDHAIHNLLPQGLNDGDFFFPVATLLEEYTELLPHMRAIIEMADAQEVYHQLQRDISDGEAPKEIQKFVEDFPRQFAERKATLLHNIAIAEQIIARDLPSYRQLAATLEAISTGDFATAYVIYRAIPATTQFVYAVNRDTLPKEQFFLLGVQGEFLAHLVQEGELAMPGNIEPMEWTQLHPQIRLEILREKQSSFWDMYNDYLYPLNVPSVFHYLRHYHTGTDLCDNLQPNWLNWLASFTGWLWLENTLMPWADAMKSFGEYGALRPDFISADHYAALVHTVEDMHLMCLYAHPQNEGRKDLVSSIHHESIVALALKHGQTDLAAELLVDGFEYAPY